jgi:hypothetical protein
MHCKNRFLTLRRGVRFTHMSGFRSHHRREARFPKPNYPLHGINLAITPKEIKPPLRPKSRMQHFPSHFPPGAHKPSKTLRLAYTGLN